MPILPKLIESFVRQRHRACGAHLRPVRHRMGADAIRVLAAPGRAVGSLRAPAGVLLSNFGLAADYVLMALAPSLTWLFVGRVISGITSASISTALPTSPTSRRRSGARRSSGKIGAAFGARLHPGSGAGRPLGDIIRDCRSGRRRLSFANALYGL